MTSKKGSVWRRISAFFMALLFLAGGLPALETNVCAAGKSGLAEERAPGGGDGPELRMDLLVDGDTQYSAVYEGKREEPMTLTAELQLDLTKVREVLKLYKAWLIENNGGDIQKDRNSLELTAAVTLPEQLDFSGSSVWARDLNGKFEVKEAEFSGKVLELRLVLKQEWLDWENLAESKDHMISAALQVTGIIFNERSAPWEEYTISADASGELSIAPYKHKVVIEDEGSESFIEYPGLHPDWDLSESLFAERAAVRAAGQSGPEEFVGYPETWHYRWEARQEPGKEDSTTPGAETITATVKYPEKKPDGALRIKKHVAGGTELGLDDSFALRVWLSGPAENASLAAPGGATGRKLEFQRAADPKTGAEGEEYTEYADLSLKAEEALRIEGIPDGTGYLVEELLSDELLNRGYQESYEAFDEEGTVEGGKEAAALIVNYYQKHPLIIRKEWKGDEERQRPKQLRFRLVPRLESEDGEIIGSLVREITMKPEKGFWHAEAEVPMFVPAELAAALSASGAKGAGRAAVRSLPGSASDAALRDGSAGMELRRAASPSDAAGRYGSHGAATADHAERMFDEDGKLRDGGLIDNLFETAERAAAAVLGKAAGLFAGRAAAPSAHDGASIYWTLEELKVPQGYEETPLVERKEEDGKLVFTVTNSLKKSVPGGAAALQPGQSGGNGGSGNGGSGNSGSGNSGSGGSGNGGSRGSGSGGRVVTKSAKSAESSAPAPAQPGPGVLKQEGLQDFSPEEDALPELPAGEGVKKAAGRKETGGLPKTGQPAGSPVAALLLLSAAALLLRRLGRSRRG